MGKIKLDELSNIEVYKLVLDGTLKRFPNYFWDKQTSMEATKWLIEEKLQWNDEDIKSTITAKIFKDNKLGGMLTAVFNGSPYEAINAIYPDIFKPWELSNAPNNYWNLDTAKEATKWLIDEKLKWNDEDIKDKLSYNTFKDNGLHGMLCIIFNNSPYRAINNSHPNRFKPWEFKVSKNYWNLDTAKEATKWLIDEKLKWSDEDIKAKLTSKTFIDSGLYGMLNLFNNSPYKVIDNAYPGRFKSLDLNGYNGMYRI